MPASLPKIDLVAASIAPEISSELINETNADGDEGVASFEYAGEIADDDSDTIGASLISSSHGNSVRNYEVYNRMEGCSSDEETQTDNDDNNNDSEVEGLPDHHYAVLNDDMFEFGEFTAAVSCSAEDIQDNTDENEWQESVTGLSLNFVAPAVQGDGGMGPPLFSSNFDEITVRDGEEPAGMSTVLPPVAVDERELSTGESRCSPAIAYVSIPPLSAGKLNFIAAWSSYLEEGYFSGVSVELLDIRTQ